MARELERRGRVERGLGERAREGDQRGEEGSEIEREGIRELRVLLLLIWWGLCVHAAKHLLLQFICFISLHGGKSNK